MPMVCEACGGHQRLMPLVGDALACGHCGASRALVRPPLMVVAGAAASGKSTLCQRLAGTVDGVVVLDADVLADDLVAVAAPDDRPPDFPAFWGALLRLAHEIGQNGPAVAYFGVTLPEQVLANAALLPYFAGVHLLGLVCDDEVLRRRLGARAGGDAAAARVEVHLDVNRRLREAAATTPDMAVVDGSRPRDEVEEDVRRWIAAIVAAGPGDGA
jgi:predicted kinase